MSEHGEEMTGNDNKKEQLQQPPVAEQGNETALDEVGALREELAAAKEAEKRNYDQYLRALADFDNLRRRSAKERQDLQKYGVEGLLREILPILDSFDKALGSDSSGDAQAGFSAGMDMVRKQLREVLSRHGLTAVNALGEAFGPNFHQALSRVEDATATAEVVREEFVKGYLLHDRLIRPAMVSVVVPVDSEKKKEG